MKTKGFTIIESLVAISILVSAVVAGFSAAQSGLSSYILSKEQVSAFYLAQEGFEQVRNIRDANRLSGNNWLAGIASNSSDPCYFGNACTVSVAETNSLIRCDGVGECPFLRKSADGFYGYNSLWPLTPYKREITLVSINSNEIAVTVTVSWSKGIISREFKARENLLNW